MLELLNAESMVKSIAAEFEIGTRENRKDQERPEKSGKTRKIRKDQKNQERPEKSGR